MKRIILILAASAFLGCCVAEEYRIFTDTEGRVIEARVVSYDVRSGKVTVERNNRRKVTVPAGIFSEADQAYIKEWVAGQDFLSNSKLRISVRKKKGKTGKDKSQTKRPKPPCHYEIQLDNRSGASFKNISMEYCLYMNNQSLNGGKDKLTIEYGSFRKIPLSISKKHVEKTKEVALFQYLERQTDVTHYSDGSSDYDTSYNKISEDDLEGMRIRIYLELPSGNTLMREICEPDSIAKKYAWKDS